VIVEVIEISYPLPGSEIGYRTIHKIFLDSNYVGYVEVGYLTKKDVKTFEKYTKRKLAVGQPFGVQIFIDKMSSGIGAAEIGNEKLLEIVTAVQRKLHGLEDRDISIIQIEKEGKKLIGKATELNKTSQKHVLRPRRL